jgi:hypothetical protein
MPKRTSVHYLKLIFQKFEPPNHTNRHSTQNILRHVGSSKLFQRSRIHVFHAVGDRSMSPKPTAFARRRSLFSLPIIHTALYEKCAVKFNNFGRCRAMEDIEFGYNRLQLCLVELKPNLLSTRRRSSVSPSVVIVETQWFEKSTFIAMVTLVRL